MEADLDCKSIFREATGFKFEKYIIGHRGAAGYAPENTFESFHKALEMNCSIIEFDVMLSQDGEAFIFHDEELERTTDGIGKFGLVSADYLKTLNAGLWFSKEFKDARIPTLRDTIHWLAHHNVQANIEIKPFPGCTKETTLAVINHLQNEWPLDKPLPLVSSFDYHALELCHSLYPELPLGLLLNHWNKNWKLMLDNINGVSIHLNRRIVTEARVKMVKQSGYHVCVFTVNRRPLAEKLLLWGVDAIFTDYPDLLGSPIVNRP